METLARASMQLISLPRPAKRRRLLDPGEAPAVLKLPDAMRQRLLPDSCCPPHPGFISGVCISCGKNVSTDGSGNDVVLLPFEYIQEGLKLSSDAVDALRKECGANLMERRRLVLVLDLDHTLLHTQIHDDDEMRVITAPPAPSEDLFEDSVSTTRLRPYARYLLTALHAFYDMYIYTMGNRAYASKTAGLLDPDGRYFKYKVISREDSTEAGTKALDIVLAPPEAVVIVDDTESVWRRKKDRKRLINIKRFYYSGFTDAVADDEEDEDLSLLYVFHALHTFHSDFFSSSASDEKDRIEGTETTNGRDVGKVMRSFQLDILCGCRIVIGDAFPAVEKEALGNIAKRLGATRLTELDQRKVTHVLARHQGTPEGKWAIANAKHLVSASWLEEAYGTWTMPTESDFKPPPSSCR